MIQNHYLLNVSDSTQIVEVRHKREKIKKMQEQDLQCALCLDFFTSPVRITNCGHNFCQQCLIGMTETPWMCPECRTEQQQRPEQLARNFFLEKTVEKLLAKKQNICAAHDLLKKLRKYFYPFYQQLP